MTHYEFYNSIPRERVSRLQAARIFPRHTMRNITIYEQFLAERERAANWPSRNLRAPTVMDAYTAVADLNALCEEQVARIVRLMDRPI